MENVMVSEKEFNKLCNKFNEYYKQVMGQSLDKEVFKKWNTVNKAYKEICKVLNTDQRQHLDAEELKRRDGLIGAICEVRVELKKILTNPNIDISYYQIVFPGEKNITMMRDGKYLLRELKNLGEHYKIINDFYVSDYEDFERDVMFNSENYDKLKMKYNKIINKLENLLMIEKYIRSKEMNLEFLIKSGGDINRQLFSEFSIKARESKEIGYIDTIYKEYKMKMLKNSFYFTVSEAIMKEYQGYSREYFKDILKGLEHEIKATLNTDVNVISDIAYKFNELVKNKSIVIDYYLILFRIIEKHKKVNFSDINIEELTEYDDPNKAKYLYESLKEKIENRIEYYNRVKVKINDFILEYKNNSFYSYTYPFIVECANIYLDYYVPSDKDLNDLDKKLAELRFVIDDRMKKDIIKAFKKKRDLRTRFQFDFQNGIFIGDGLKDINLKIDNINTFGGFANFKNNIVRLEMSRLLTDTAIYLRNTGKSLKGKEDANDIKKLVDRAMILWDQIRVILEGTKDYAKINVSKFKVVDYRLLSKVLQNLKKIDFYNDTLEQINYKLLNVDDFLNRDKYDEQLINMVGSRRK